MQHAIQMLNAVTPLSDRVTEYLLEHLQEETFLKREYLLKENKYCDKIWFIDKGLAGCFYEKSDKTLCAWFMKESDVVTSVPAFYLRIPAPESIIALDDMLTYSLNYNRLQYMYDTFPEFNKHGRMLTEKYYVLAEQRMRAFHNQAPIEKYKYLMDNFPELIQRVSNTNLASYMGITIETLSRIKSRLN